MISPEQCRSARLLLDWNVVQLAEAAGSTPMTIHMFEYGKSKPRLVTLQRLRAALEAAGVEFITESRCVRLKEDSGA